MKTIQAEFPWECSVERTIKGTVCTAIRQVFEEGRGNEGRWKAKEEE